MSKIKNASLITERRRKRVKIGVIGPEITLKVIKKVAESDISDVQVAY